MLSFPSLIPFPLALIPDAHNCSFVPRNNSLHILFSTLYFLSSIRSAKNSNKVTLIHPALPVLSLRINPGQSSDINPCHHNVSSVLLFSLSPFYLVTFYLILLFVSHSFFFAERNLSPKGIPHRHRQSSMVRHIYLTLFTFYELRFTPLFVSSSIRGTNTALHMESPTGQEYFFQVLLLPCTPASVYRVLRKYLNQNLVIFECFGK